MDDVDDEVAEVGAVGPVGAVGAVGRESTCGVRAGRVGAGVGAARICAMSSVHMESSVADDTISPRAPAR